ncbi:serine acetyltransferase [Enterococcus faecium]|nr:serine acetyltransferase [Enterococcus faecium]MDQ8428523.1 serine acetyltransferase [Enterococcus faecium]
MDTKTILEMDYLRYTGKIDPYIKKYLKLFRKTQACENKLKYLVYHWMLKRHRIKRGIEIDAPVKIGPGFCIVHPFNITINDKVIIGSNCNIHKGVLIGQENRGERKGAPIIGDKVWIGANACIVGGITIGSDVLIAPNSFVNKTIPSHSIVFGNPCIIVSRDNATKEYINLQ